MSTTTSAKTFNSIAMLALLLATFLVTGNSFANSVNQGSWVNKQKTIQGNWEVKQENGNTIVSFKNNFKTRGGPDLKVFLSKNDISNANGRNATNGSVLLSPLKSTNGSQEYVIPSNINVNDFASVLIHCEQFSVLWGGFNI